MACSGGADSLALLAATVFEARGSTPRVVGVTVDHGLQDGSADHAARRGGADGPARGRRDGDGPGAGRRGRAGARGRGPRGAVRRPRPDGGALRRRRGAARAHARRPGRDRAARADPRLRWPLDRRHAPRASTATAARCSTSPAPRPRRPAGPRASSSGPTPTTPTPASRASRVRHTVLPLLERELGPGSPRPWPARPTSCAQDMEALDELALDALATHDDGEHGFDVWHIETLAVAVRTRMLRLAALRAGCPPGELFAVHVAALEQQVWNRTHLPKVDPAARPRHGVPLRGPASLRSDRCGILTRMDSSDVEERSRQGPLHRGGDPGGSARWRPRSRPTTSARTCSWSASCAAP